MNMFFFRKTSSREDLAVLMCHFKDYPLITKKFADYWLFREIMDLFNRKGHLTKEGLQQIVNLRASLNKGLSSPCDPADSNVVKQRGEGLKEAFPKTIPVSRPLVNDQVIKDPYWLAGFATGEGCFSVGLYKSRLYKTGFQVSIRFSISQHSCDSKLMESLINYLSCGNYMLHSCRETGEFIVTKFSSIEDTIIPFFQKYPILGVKALDFVNFCQVAYIMKVKGHLTKSGLEQIISLREKMNTKIPFKV
uniref:LAGLIDADG endonuclease n=1 Tax=Juglanconis juglandina TaxID=1940567 RepID=A0A291LIZ0_9PEZI|nr:LAGLIDADG endonuclease [Juglanconis juglandina]